jgi:hypothetical protein
MEDSDLNALPPRKEPLVPTDYETGWALEPYWMLSKGEKSLTPTGNQTTIFQSSSLQPTYYLTILSKLSINTCLGLIGK